VAKSQEGRKSSIRQNTSQLSHYLNYVKKFLYIFKALSYIWVLHITTCFDKSR